MTPATTQDDSVLDLFESTTEGEPVPAGPGRRGPAGGPPVDHDRARRRRRLLAWVLALLLLAVAALGGWYLLNRKPLSQLPGVNVVPVPTYRTSVYQVEKPLGVAVTPDGGKIFASHGGAKAGITQFDRDGRVVRELEFPVETGDGHVPVYLALGPDGRLYAGDRGKGAVYVFSPEGAYESVFTPQDPALRFSPLGVAVGRDGSLYVADVLSNKVEEHRVLVFGPDGALLRTLGLGKLNYPNQLVVDAQGHLFVADSNNGRLVVIDPAGEVTSLVASGVGQGDLGLPRGLGIDDRGRVFVVDTTDHMVRMYTQGASATDRPAYQGSFGDMGVQDGQFLYPNGLAVDARARIYITDRENDRIQVCGF